MATMSLWTFISGFSQGLGFTAGVAVSILAIIALRAIWNRL